jgi:hypothetical protein
VLDAKVSAPFLFHPVENSDDLLSVPAIFFKSMPAAVIFTAAAPLF